jgi:hypothetical protein
MIALHIDPAVNLPQLAYALREAGLVIDGRLQPGGFHLRPIDRPATPAARIRAAMGNRRAAR